MVILFVRILSQLSKMQRRYQLLVADESAYWAIRGAAEFARSAAEIKTGTLHPTLKQGISVQHIKFNYGTKKYFPRLECRN